MFWENSLSKIEQKKKNSFSIQNIYLYTHLYIHTLNLKFQSTFSFVSFVWMINKLKRFFLSSSSFFSSVGKNHYNSIEMHVIVNVKYSMGHWKIPLGIIFFISVQLLVEYTLQSYNQKWWKADFSFSALQPPTLSLPLSLSLPHPPPPFFLFKLKWHHIYDLWIHTISLRA